MFSTEINLGDKCIEFFHLGRYIVGLLSEILIYGDAIASPNEKNQCGYPHSNALIHLFCLKKKKMFFLLKTASAVSCLKPNTND